MLRASGTAARLVRRRSRGYAVRRWALRTTGVRRSVRIDLLIGNNTLPTWAGASRALARLALSHLVTYPHKLTLRSSQLASPQGSSLNRLLAWRAWLLGVSCGLRVEDALQADGAASHPGLERLPARHLHGQRAALTHSLPRLRSPLLTVGLLPSALPL